MFTHSAGVYVSSAHRYWNFARTEVENRALYGAQASKEGVGSNFRLEAGVTSALGDEIDLSAALALLKSLADHRCFFADVPEFSSEGRPSTLETIALYLGNNLFATGAPPHCEWAFLRVAESERLACIVRPRDVIVEMRVRTLNLEVCLERAVDPQSGLAFHRSEVWDAVRTIAPEFAVGRGTGEEAWARQIRSALEIKVKGLKELRIDMGGHRFLRV